jgi:hypothetical protein
MQDTQQNRRANPDVTELVNGSDEALLAGAINAALKCAPVVAPDLADNMAKKPALFLNELSARQHQPIPRAFVPASDPMVLVDDQMNIVKLNLYRVGVNQDPVDSLCQASTTLFCTQLLESGVPRLAKQKPFFVNQASPNADLANNLFTFLAVRLNTTWNQANGLGCAELLNKPTPVNLTVTNGVVTDANYILPTKRRYLRDC